MSFAIPPEPEFVAGQPSFTHANAGRFKCHVRLCNATFSLNSLIDKITHF
jgi:hypothetical protein